MMKAYMLTLCALALPASAAAADTTLNEINARLERLEAELKQSRGNDSNLLIVFYVQIMPDDFVMQLHRF